MADTQKKKGGIIKGTAKTIAAIYIVAAIGGGLYQVFNDHSESSAPTKFGQGLVTGVWVTTQLAVGSIVLVVGAVNDTLTNE